MGLGARTIKTRFHSSHLLWLALVVLFLVIPLAVVAQSPGPEIESDPVVYGAWLYGGNCVRCHGPYEKERIGEVLNKKELKSAIEGSGRPSCQVTWSRSRGGSLGSKEISALVAYILAWEESGEEPDMPPLPEYPTPTPYLTPTAIGGGDFATPTPGPTSTPTPPADVRLAMEGSEVATGAYLYTMSCYRCHLDYDYARIGKGLEPKKIKRTIEEGKVGTSMPRLGWRQGGPLKSRDVLAIIAYISAFEQLDDTPALPGVLFVPPTPDPAALLPVQPQEVPSIRGDSERGLALYRLHCLRCHGTDGKGHLGPDLVKDWHSVRSDLTIRSTIVQGVPGSPMPAWRQAEGGFLSDEQIADLVELLLSWSKRVK